MTIPAEIEAKVREYQENRPPQPSERATPLQFVEALYRLGSTYQVARELDMSAEMASLRRLRLEEKLQIELPKGRWETWRQTPGQNRIIDYGFENETILVGSDLHKWPGLVGTGERAFIAINQMLKPSHVFLNGDGIDGKKIARHARIGWEDQPTVAEEIEAFQDFSHKLQKENPNGKYVRTRGNHDELFDAYFSNKAPGVEGVKGTKLDDHFPMWTQCVSININRGQRGHTIIKHRFRHGGIHADWQNVLKSGVNIVFGHLHCQRVRPFDDARGRRYGCDAGMLAPVQGPQFAYCEADVNDWRSGFLVLTYVNGELMEPEKVTVIDEDNGIVYFRGQRWQV